MELDVTHMVEDADNMFDLAGSQMEHGANAGPYTWRISVAYGKEHPLLTTDEQRDAARAHFSGYGAWDEDTIAAWSEDDLQGIMCQEVASAIREMEGLEPDEYERRCQDGTCSGSLSPGDNGRWYFYLGN